VSIGLPEPGYLFDQHPSPGKEFEKIYSVVVTKETLKKSVIMEFGALNDMLKLSADMSEARECKQVPSKALIPTRVIVGEVVSETKSVDSSSKRNEIWAEDEVDTPHDACLKTKDDRPAPEYDILYKQSVGLEDVYLGMSDKDPSSNSCTQVVLRIKLPEQKYSDLDLDVQKQSIILSSPDFRLATYLPYPVDHENGSAKWLQESSTLSITLSIDNR